MPVTINTGTEHVHYALAYLIIVLVSFFIGGLIMVLIRVMDNQRQRRAAIAWAKRLAYYQSRLRDTKE